MIQLLLVFFLFLCPSLTAEEEVKSLIPVDQQINDFETRLNIAKIFSHHKSTQDAAADLLISLLNESTENADTIIKNTLPLLEKEDLTDLKTISIVYKEGQVSDFEAKLALAQIYSRYKKTQLTALKLYGLLLTEQPNNVDLYIEMGRLYMLLKQRKEGLALFYRGLEIHPNNPELLVATAQGEVSVGYAARARCHFLKALEIIEASLESSSQEKEKYRLSHEGYYKTLIDFADGMMMWGDFYRAESIFREAICRNPYKLEFYLKLAWSLARAQRYEEAEEIYRGLLLTHPNHPKVLLSLARLKFQEKKFDAAQEITEALLEINSQDPEYLLLMADILFMQYRYCEAISFYEAFQDDSEYGIEAYVGIGRSLQKLGQYEEAHAVFEKGFSLFPSSPKIQYYLADCVEGPSFIDSIIASATSVQELEEWGKVYIQNGLPESALFFYQAAADLDPEYFPGMIGLAETLSINYHFGASLLLYHELLDLFPENSKLMLAIARVNGWAKWYDVSIEWYNRIISINPEDPVLYREKARVALWGNKFYLGMKTYDQLLACPVTTLSEYLIQKSIRLEKRAKALVWNKWYIHSLDAYRELLDFSPGNEEGLFDYAQSYCSLNLCDYSREVYEAILHIDPSHNLVKQALARNELKCHPLLRNNIAYWREIGSGTFSQSQIARYKVETVFEQPLSCRSHLRFIQQEYVENPFFNFKFYPAEGQTIEADNVFNEYVSCSFSATYKNYFKRFKSTITSHNWILFNANDYFQLLLSCNKVDEIYNFFSLKQAIQSINSFVTISSNLNHHWYVSGTYENYQYNDHNNQNHINLYTDYQVSDVPCIFKLILQGDYRNTAHETINCVVGETLVNVIHPYWTPIDYYAGALSLEFRYDYRRFIYCEAPQRYIDLKITGVTDSVDNSGVQTILEWKHEFARHWGFEVKGLIHRSKQWNAEGAWGTLYYRF